MAKLIGPCMSLDARGTLGKSIVYSIRKGTNYVRTLARAKDPKTEKQRDLRSVFGDGASKWRWAVIPLYQKTDWASYSAGTTESGWNRFMRYYLKANFDSSLGQKISYQIIPSPQ